MTTKIIPRYEWIKNRVDEILSAISEARKIDDIKIYKQLLCEYTDELRYLSHEWFKYYEDEK